VKVLIDPDRLRLELARRGWTARELSVRSGASGPTLSAVMAGRGVRPGTIKRIALALSQAPVVEGIDSLLW
jgi:transcriptional regulator with XRE-family HTH domain